MPTTTITLPVPPVIAGFLALIFVSVALVVLLPDRDRLPPQFRFLDSAGLPRPVVATLFAVFGALSLLALFAALMLLVEIARKPASPSLGTGALIVGLLGAPFLIWRTIVSQRTVNIADEALFNDKINAASTDLAARRETTREIGRGAQKRILTEWQDDLVTRAAAIDRLEGLVEEHPEAATRVARLLSVYVRELSAQCPPTLPASGMSNEAIHYWLGKIEPARSDIEKAARALGRLKQKKNVQSDLVRINLEGANLQLLNLDRSDFTNAKFDGAMLQGASLSRSSLKGAQFNSAQMQGSDLSSANIEDAEFIGANLCVTRLYSAVLNRSNLSNCNLRGSNLTLIRAEKVFLNFADLEGSKLILSNLNGSVLIGTRLKGAELYSTKMRGAHLDAVQIDQKSDVSELEVIGARVRNIDEKTAELIVDLLDQVFGDSSVRLPDATEWPKHWGNEKHASPLSEPEFLKKWRAWQATLDPPLDLD